MNRNIGIDIIRGISALLIVAYHYTCHYNLSPYTEGGHTDWNMVVSWGCLAVISFFMISGYLSSSKIKDDQSPLGLLQKRFRRLYPTFWASMIVSLVITVIASFDSYTIKDFILNVTMLPSLFGAKPIDGVYWTQQYELIFYFLIVGIIVIRLAKRLLWVLLVWVILSIGLYYLQLNINNIAVRFCRIMLIPQYCSAFIVGMMIRNLVGRKDLFFSVVIILFSGLNFFLWHNAIQLLYFVISFILLYVVINTPPHLSYKVEQLFRPVLFISSISYPLYLLHQKIGYVIIFNLVTNLYWTSEWILLIPFGFAIFLAWILHNLVEVKFN